MTLKELIERLQQYPRGCGVVFQEGKLILLLGDERAVIEDREEVCSPALASSWECFEVWSMIEGTNP